MGLFDKKAEACIAFVGKYGEEGAAITRSREREQARACRENLNLITAMKCGDLPVLPCFFSDWSDQVYDSGTLYAVQSRGFAGTLSGERAQLRDALCAFLAENYGVTEPEPHPDCILDNGGVFYILCRVTASKQALGL